MPGVTLAQHDHASGGAPEHKAEAPHGGEIKDVGKYHLEIVFDPMASLEKMSIYILKSNLNTLNSKDASGTISLNYKNGTEVNTELLNDNINKLFCDVKDVVNPFNAIIKIVYKGKSYSTTFFYKGMK
ncbi:MAG: hypothetical protein HYX39_09535 [Bacteroidetes bacterium]|nr:hypothetical protein [Bacteroidota bacterium]